MRIAVVTLTIASLFVIAWAIPLWVLLAALLVGGLWLYAWDRVETRKQYREGIEPTKARRR